MFIGNHKGHPAIKSLLTTLSKPPV